MAIQLPGPSERSTPSAQQRGGLRYQGAAAPETFSRANIQAPMTAGQGGEALGQAMMKTGDRLYEAGERDRLKTATLDTAKAKSYFLRENIRIQGELEQDPDYQNYETNYNKRSAEAYQNAMGMVKDPEARAMLDMDLKDSGARSAASIKSLAYKKSVQARTGLFQETLNESLDSALAAPDEPTRKQALNTAGESILAAFREGIIDEGEMKKTTREFKEKYGEAWVSTQDPETLLKLLTTDKAAPLSVRNNNPGNIRGNDGNFQVFPDKESGLAAMKNDLTIKVTGKSKAMAGKFGEGYQPTVTNVISTWAPDSENDTKAYIATVSKETGFAPDKVLTEADIDKLMTAMIKVEGGPDASKAFAKTGTPLDYMPAEKRIKLKSDVSQKVIYESMNADPAGTYQRLKSGEFDNVFDPEQIIKFQKEAQTAFTNKQDVAEIERLMVEAGNNRAEYDKFINGELNTPSAIQDSQFSPEMKSYMMKEISQSNDKAPAPELRLQEFNRLNDRLQQIKVDMGGKSGEKFAFSDFKAGVKTMQDMKKFQTDVIKAVSQKLISKDEGDAFMKVFSNSVMAAVSGDNTEGGSWKKGVQDPYARAFDSFNAYLKRNDRPKDLLAKKELTLRFADFLGEYQSTGKASEDEKIIDTAINAATASFAKDEMPVLRTLPGTPNAAIDGDGLKKTVTGGKSDLKPDASLTVPFKIMEDKNGNRARVYPDGRIEEIK